VRAFNVTPPEDPSGLHLPEAARLRPAIAVLPFELRAANDDTATLGELLADEIITALSGTKELDVISRLSTRSMARQRFGLCQIWSQLQSDYVLAGRPRARSGGTELIIELTEVRSKTLKWSQTRDVGAQDSSQVRAIAEEIASEVMAAILIGESERATMSPLASLKSYTLLFAAITLMDRWTRAGFERSRELLVELRDRAPLHPLPNAWLAAWHIRSISQGWASDPAEHGRAAIELAQRSLDADPHCSLALAMDGWANVHAHKRLDIASDRLSLAVESNPNDSLAWLLKGVTHAFNSEGANATAAADRAIRLSPVDPRRSYFEAMAATAELAAGHYDRVIEFAKRSLRANRLHASTLRSLAVAQWLSGDGAGARNTITQLLALEPHFTTSGYLRSHPAGDMEFGRIAANALHSAGAPA
jgi:adenylate cyclase